MPDLTTIQLDHLHPHPKNPRIDAGKETVQKIAYLMRERGFDPAHALIVRPLASPPEGHYQILAGHRRARAAKSAGVTEVPCWVRPMSDGEAHALLLEDNYQDGFHPIEEGQHALDSGLSQRVYAERHKLNRNILKPKIAAAEVYGDLRPKRPLTGEDGIGKRWRALAALHAAHPWLWPFWAPRLVEERWTIQETDLRVGGPGGRNRRRLGPMPRASPMGCGRALCGRRTCSRCIASFGRSRIASSAKRSSSH